MRVTSRCKLQLAAIWFIHTVTQVWSSISTSSNAPHLSSPRPHSRPSGNGSQPVDQPVIPRDLVHCSPSVPCEELPQQCITCDFMNSTHVYGSAGSTTCEPLSTVQCLGPRTFQRAYSYRYCYQMDQTLHVCTPNTQCRARPNGLRVRYTANCTLTESAPLCLGRRTFPRRLLCNWTGGYRWSTALVLSVTLGGVGADRFYLGQWREGIAKLFSFGGLGVWTLVDVVLVAIGYVGPGDGSLYIY